MKCHLEHENQTVDVDDMRKSIQIDFVNRIIFWHFKFSKTIGWVVKIFEFCALMKINC